MSWIHDVVKNNDFFTSKRPTVTLDTFIVKLFFAYQSHNITFCKSTSSQSKMKLTKRKNFACLIITVNGQSLMNRRKKWSSRLDPCGITGDAK